jgi:hypothetical protein
VTTGDGRVWSYAMAARYQVGAAIPVQLPVASLPALHALGIVPVPASFLPEGQVQPPAVFRGSTCNGTMLSLDINVSLLQSAQMSGLAMILNSLLSRSDVGYATATSAHQALRCAEVTRLICDQCDRTTLASLARTRRDISEAALDVLWHSIYNVGPLIRCMPEDLWEEVEINGNLAMLVVISFFHLRITVQLSDRGSHVG